MPKGVLSALWRITHISGVREIEVSNENYRVEVPRVRSVRLTSLLFFPSVYYDHRKGECHIYDEHCTAFSTLSLFLPLNINFFFHIFKFFNTFLACMTFSQFCSFAVKYSKKAASPSPP